MKWKANTTIQRIVNQNLLWGFLTFPKDKQALLFCWDGLHSIYFLKKKRVWYVVATVSFIPRVMFHSRLLF